MPRIPLHIRHFNTQGSAPRAGIMAAPGEALAGLGETMTAIADSAIKKDKETKSMMYIYESEIKAQEEWTEELNRVKGELPPGDPEIVKRMSDFTRESMNGYLGDAPDSNARLGITKMIGSARLSFIKETIKGQKADQKGYGELVLNQTFDFHANAVKNNWRDLPAHFAKGIGKIQASPWLNPIEKATKDEEFINMVSSNAVHGWFNEQPDKISAINSLDNNSGLPNEISFAWNNLNPEQKTGLSQKMLEGEAQRMRYESSLDSIREKAEKEEANKQMLKFYDTNTTQDERVGIMQTLKNLGWIDENQFIAMRGHLSGQTIADDELALLNIEESIRKGEITSVSEIPMFGVSFETVRTKLMPLMFAQRDDRYRSAESWMRTELGIPSEALFTLDDKETLRDEMTGLAKLLEFKINNPGADADYISKARELVDEVRKEKNIKKKASANRLINQRDMLIKAGKHDAASSIQLRIDALGVENE